MAKFHYKMQNILNIKQKLEEQAKMRFAQEMVLLKEEEEKLLKLHNKKHRYDVQGQELRKKSLNVIELKENNEAIRIIKTEIEEQKEKVAIAQDKVEKAREELNEAIQERKTHEKLSDEALELFKKEIGAKEDKEVDELTSYAYGLRKSKEELGKRKRNEE